MLASGAPDRAARTSMLLLTAIGPSLWPGMRKSLGGYPAYMSFRIFGRENQMPIRLRSRIHRVIGMTITLLVVVVPLQALADEPLIESAVETASPTVGVVEDVVEPVADTVGDVVEAPAQIVDVVGETAGGAVEEVGDSTTEVVNEVPTVDEAQEAAGNTSGQVQENVGAASGAGGTAVDENAGSGSSTDTEASPGGGKDPSDGKQAPHRNQTNDEITVASTGSAWRRMHFARLGVVVPAPSFLYQPITLPGGSADEPVVDPCEDDPGLACLGLLFGLGEFAEAGGDVLGLFLAATGVALRGLIVLAFALLLAGIVALSIAPRRATPGGMG